MPKALLLCEILTRKEENRKARGARHRGRTEAAREKKKKWRECDSSTQWLISPNSLWQNKRGGLVVSARRSKGWAMILMKSRTVLGTHAHIHCSHMHNMHTKAKQSPLLVGSIHEVMPFAHEMLTLFSVIYRCY